MELTYTTPETRPFDRNNFVPPFLDSAAGREELCYIRLDLVEESLDKESIRRLGKLGVDCITDARPKEAYAIIQKSARLLNVLRSDPAIIGVYLEEPPCSK